MAHSKKVISKSDNMGKINGKDIKYTYKPLKDSTHSSFEPAMKGWNEGVMGIVFDYDYVSRIPMHLAETYEMYRQYAIGLIAAGIRLQRWNSPVVKPQFIDKYIDMFIQLNSGYFRNNIPLDYPVGNKFWMPANSEWEVGRDSQPNVY